MVKNTVIAAISAVMMPLALAWGLIVVLATAEQLAAISTEQKKELFPVEFFHRGFFCALEMLMMWPMVLTFDFCQYIIKS